jgi:Tfp pilus assembly protein PilX
MTMSRRGRGDDTGAALVIALVFITVVGLVTAVVLSFGDASMRASAGLRQQASQAYAADGAAKIALNALRLNGPAQGAGTSCPADQKAFALSNFPESTTTTPAGSVVVCESVLAGGTASQGSLNSSNIPPEAVSTLADRSAQPDPSYPPPTVAPRRRSVPACPKSGGLVTFTPGVYTDASALSECDHDTLWFRPGTYYFDFAADAPTWTLNSGALVAGTPTSRLTGAAPAMPGSCVSPLTSTAPNAGAEFVFGGVSSLVIAGKARAELCASYNRTRPPIAVYGLRSPVGTVSAQGGCITAPVGCALISSADLAAASVMYVQGTVYAPSASLALSYGRFHRLATGQFVTDGVIARSVGIVPYGSPTGVSVPDANIGPPGAETVVLLDVYVCPGEQTCNAGTGRLQLEAKVGISNPQQVRAAASALAPADGPRGLVPGARTVQIYSWAVKRCRAGSATSCQA